MRIKLLAGWTVGMWIFFVGILSGQIGQISPAAEIDSRLIFTLLIVALPNVMLAGHILGWWNLD